MALIFPPYVTWELEYPPLGLAYIASSLEREDHKVEILDASILNMSYSDVLNWLIKFDPGAIGITTLTPHFWQVKALSHLIKRELPNVPLIFGGPHATVLPKQTLEETPADIVVIGEGESTTVELAEAIEMKRAPDDVKGLMYRDGARIVFTGYRAPIGNLDDIPFPARHLLPLFKYGEARRLPSMHERHTSAITSRGCPFNCLFCSSRNVWGRAFRHRSVNNVIDELHELVDSYKIKEISWQDDCFTFDKRWTMSLCREVVREKLDITWRCLARVDQVDDELLKRMKLAGCYAMWFGVESGNQEILGKIRKNITLQQAEDAVKLAKHYRFETHVFFMIGNYGENYKTIMDTLKFAKKLNPSHIAVSIATPYPGTDFLTLAREKGLIERENWDGLRVGPDSMIRTEDLTSRDLERLRNAMSTAFYGRWAYFRENAILGLRVGDPLGFSGLRKVAFPKFLEFLRSVVRFRSARVVISELANPEGGLPGQLAKIQPVNNMHGPTGS